MVVELKLIEESGLAACLGLSDVLMKRAKLGVNPQFGSVGVVGSFLTPTNIFILCFDVFFCLGT